MRTLFVGALLLLSPAAGAAPAVDARFAELAEDYWESQMRTNPTWATFVAHPRYHDRLEDISDAGRKRNLRDIERFLERLERIPAEGLSPERRVSREILGFMLERDREGHNHPIHEWTVDHMDGPQSWIPTVVEAAQPMRGASDARALIERMEAIPVYFRRHIVNLREGLARGRPAARIAVEKSIRQLSEQIEQPAAETPFAAAAGRLPAGTREKYEPRVLAAVDRRVKPAYRDYLRFLKEDYLPRARPDDRPGIGHIPGGPEAYRYLVRRHTTLRLEPKELHRIGLEELEGIHAEMKAIARRMGHAGDLKSFFERVRSERANFFTTRQEVLEAARGQVARTYERLPEFFGRLPTTALEVRPVEEYKEKNEVAARYFQPPDDLSRPGIYFINTYRPETIVRHGMASLAAHEGVPGHHLQLALSVEARGLPAFQRHADFTAFVEGWALYAERLADEMGLYPDDLSRLGMLSDQAWRACRLVVDTGLHAMGWDRRRAIDFMLANLADSEEAVTTEVDRYIVWPGQALAYKVGQREISALREDVEARLKGRFDVKAFHDAVLRHGALPLPLMRRLVLEELAP